jgi:hypothetical protein
LVIFPDLHPETNIMAITATDKGRADTDILRPKSILSYKNMMGGVDIAQQKKRLQIWTSKE